MSTPASRIVKKIQKDPSLNGGIDLMLSRRREFPSDQAAILAGLAMDPASRDAFNTMLDEYHEQRSLPNSADELVIGGGWHAAVWCAVRVAMGFPPPYVISNERLGGSFGWTKKPSFFTNSRNRPGEIDLPGEQGGLNVIPGAMIQPSMIGNSEYLTDSDFAFTVRMALAQFSRPVKGEVQNMEIGRRNRRNRRDARVFIRSADVQRTFTVRRVIDARGLVQRESPTSDRIINFKEWMIRQDDNFPLRGLKKVAVLGSGDSGKCTIESLVGQSPGQHYSTAMLDYVEKIDWYGPGVATTCETFQTAERSRYRKIGPLIGNRITPFRTTATVEKGYGCGYVNGRPYDLVILCLGARPAQAYIGCDYFMTGDTKLGLVSDFGPALEQPYYMVGPAAGLAYSDRETTFKYAIRPENRDAIFRLAPRTATLASMLD